MKRVYECRVCDKVSRGEEAAEQHDRDKHKGQAGFKLLRTRKELTKEVSKLREALKGVSLSLEVMMLEGRKAFLEAEAMRTRLHKMHRRAQQAEAYRDRAEASLHIALDALGAEPVAFLHEGDFLQVPMIVTDLMTAEYMTRQGWTPLVPGTRGTLK